jgi:hypothetical protein
MRIKSKLEIHNLYGYEMTKQKPIWYDIEKELKGKIYNYP